MLYGKGEANGLHYDKSRRSKSRTMNVSSSFSLQRPIIAWLTDFGSSDATVGILKGVAVGIVPEVQLIDLTHDIAPQRVASAAWILSSAYRYFPKGTVYVCVVDPGVGSTRRAIAAHAGDWFFVGPDNGLFSYIYAEQPLHEVVTLSNPAYQLPHVSSTFHGRDIFAPAGAHIARGIPLAELGPSVDPSTLIRLPVGTERQGSHIEASIVHVDHFGNLITGIPLSLVPDLFSSAGVQLTFPARGITITERRRFFAEHSHEDETHPFIYGDSSGYLGVAIRNGNAAQTLGVKYGDRVTFFVGA
jgi:S-adenosylmethionine hydrolase